MGQLQKVPLIQCNYVKPSANEIMSFVNVIKDLSLKQIINKCISNQNKWGKMVIDFLEEKVKSAGECFCKSVTLCSLLRTLGYSEKVCFVIIACHNNENFGNATHATLLLKENEEWYIIDTTKDSIDEAMQKIPSLLYFTKHNRVICLFNETHGFIAEGDGIISNIPIL
ncbi:MAG: hypothetical protein KAX49_11585 [Halanaerobiales bacterium]|nr:hypothetical protein [Halanaerobiales bacterium]